MAVSQQSLAPPLGLCYGLRLRPHISDQPPTLLWENLHQMTKTFHNRCKISGLCHLSSTFHQYIQILQPTLVISTKPSPNWEQLHMIKSSGASDMRVATQGAARFSFCSRMVANKWMREVAWRRCNTILVCCLLMTSNKPKHREGWQKKSFGT